MDNKRKNSNSAEGPHPKRRKIEIVAEDYFSTLPKEIFHHILSFVDGDQVIALKILSMTSKKFNNALLANENHLWYSIYLRAKFLVNFDTIRKNSFVNVDDWQFWDNMTKSDAELMLDAHQTQQELYNSPTTYVETEGEYRSLHVEGSYSPEWFWPKPLDLSKDKYDANVNYRELAIDCWWKRLQFELLLKLDSYHQKEIREKTSPKKSLNNDEESGDKESDGEESDNKEKSDEEDCSSSCELDSSLIESPEMSNEGQILNYQLEKRDKDQRSSEESIDDDDNITLEPCFLEREPTEAFLTEVSTLENFSLFVQILSGAAIGHVPRPDYAIEKHNKEICTCLSIQSDERSEAEVFFEHIKHALNLDSIMCMQHIICALHTIGIADVLFLHDLVKEKFPFLATIHSVYNIEEHLFRSYDSEENSFFFALNADLNADGTKLPDWLAFNVSLFQLMRKAGVFSGSPNATGYAMECLCDFIKSVIGTILQNKNITVQKDDITVDIHSSDVQKALVSMSIDHEYDHHHKILYRDNEWLNENALMMYSDSECETYVSSYEDESVEDEDLSEYKVQTKENKDNESVDEEEKCDLLNNFIDNDDNEDTPLNDLLKQHIPSLSTVNDSSPLFINTAIRHAQIDEVTDTYSNPYSAEFGSVADEKEHKLDNKIEDIETELVENGLYVLEGQELTATWMTTCLQQEACYYHGTTKLDSTTIENFIAKNAEDLPINELSEEKQKQIFAIRRETNKLLKEQFLNEKVEFESKRWQRLQDNFDKYCKEISPEDMMYCKSLEIDLTIDNDLIPSVIERAITIISNCKSLKTVKIRGIEIEAEFNYETELCKLFDQLEKCQTLEGLIVTEWIPSQIISSFVEKKKLKRFYLNGKEQL